MIFMSFKYDIFQFMKPTQESIEKVKSEFAENGISISEWARVNGFSSSLVYQILEGQRSCLRGQSHKIAVALKLKSGKVSEATELFSLKTLKES
jgi:gp16 family phage-associated protein